ncbi:CopG family ribbon-helix-helix protein [Alicyclobacillus dauci]|uniref:Ribbon-helix-helix protein, CopG family n=1 Tax=Alicyclobacillus dauci TaxID=1475485 RepID=A0ABY6Z2Y0_9BACL|nr:ribbon-helix-helix protein, CopG family [Alicyclobacillus dauci]WAH36681.1 ribbon-helix-helix protein, CopG family [Alicyclobacillus dauci]
MSGKKRMIVNVPEQLLEQVDGVARTGSTNRSQIVREALRMYVSTHLKTEIREQMQQGYLEMARLNLRIASELFPLEQEAGGTVDRLVSGV